MAPVQPLWIDNEDVSSAIEFPVINGQSGKTVHTANGATPELAVAAVESAQRAFGTWSKTSPWERRKLLQSAARILHNRRQEISELIKLETPAPDFMVEEININNGIALFEELAAQITNMTNGMLPHCRESNRMAFVVKQPYGVQLGIAPWNASLFLALRSVITPISCGNTAILKASELSPGHRKEDAAQIVETLISHPAVRKVNFTGSTAVGKIIAAKAADYAKPCILELGGKAPLIVFEDADLTEAAKAAVMGAFGHHGQICMGTDTVLVHKSVAETLISRLSAEAPQIPRSWAVSDQQAIKTEALVEDAINKGARLAFGKLERNGSSLHPTILTGVKPSMRLYSEESFGPTLAVLAFESEDEGVALANGHEYGLSASVFTKNVARGIRIARRIDSGSVHINSMTVHDEVQLPHGGTRSSGWGRFGVPWAFDEFLQIKTITLTDSDISEHL
ncbi:hypothetical protein N7474_008073 [Penicillium riverlandense]|uniref:uncharacterized protein n=1 Tax=Penicillium riverlandense TaxID=1903569 RepID=UPI002549A498|nr:uncharacterized protein N7474_008073 [Penicillium riverlandense]KAJ5811772.1 hypothetical protein N7474_008073 [Penicillium riverlandense]